MSLCVCACVGHVLQMMKSKDTQNKTKKTPRMGQQEGETLKFKVDNNIDNSLISANKYEMCKYKNAIRNYFNIGTIG